MIENIKIAVNHEQAYLCLLTGQIIPEYKLSKKSDIKLCPICGARALPGKTYYLCADSCTLHPTLSKNRCDKCNAPVKLLAEFDFGLIKEVIKHGSEI